MGNEVIHIEGDKACLRNGSAEDAPAIDVTDFARGISRQTLAGLDDEPLADNLKWRVRCGPVSVYIVELKPEVRWVQWLADDSPEPYGPQAKTTPRSLAMPYVILKIPFLRGMPVPRVEVFYRNLPLRSADDELYWCNLLNVSPNAHGCHAWFCTQYLQIDEAQKSATLMLDAVVQHLWSAAFNRSSEAHEGDSCFAQAVREQVDERIADAARWELETQANPRFMLDVAWKPVGLTIRQLIHQELTVLKQQPAPSDALALGNILLRQIARKRPR